jgi:membrane protein insertase Oxa1/YidC/SpoIIIJ
MKSIRICGWILVVLGCLFLFIGETFIYGVIFIPCGIGIINKQNWARLGIVTLSIIAGVVEIGSLIANLSPLAQEPKRNIIFLAFLIMIFTFTFWFFNKKTIREKFN